MQKVIAIDFDDTIVEVDFPTIIGIVGKADYYIRKLFDEGFYIIIWTCRYGLRESEAKEFLRKHNVPFHKLNEHHPDLIKFYQNDTRKIAADIYIDDKCLMGLPSWEEIYNIVKNKHIQHPVLLVTKLNTHK